MPNLARLPITGSDANTWSDILNRQIAQTTSAVNGAFNSFEVFSARPTNLIADDEGMTYLYTQTGNCHQWSGTEWKVQNKSEINVKDYGAVGDGVVDDTDAIQKCLNGQFQKNIFFPAGTYKITKTITHSGSLALIGEGTERVRINNYAPICFNIDGYGYGIKGVQFVNFASGAIALKLKGRQYIVSEVSFTGVWSKCLELREVWDSKFEKLYIANDVKNRTGIGFDIKYSVNNTITNSYLGYCNKIINIDGDYFSPVGYFCEGWLITDNILIESNVAVSATRITSINVSNNIIDFINEIGVELQYGYSGMITNNWFAGAKSNFTAVVVKNDLSTGTGFNNATISGNFFTQVGEIITQPQTCKALIINSKFNVIMANHYKDIPEGVVYGNSNKFIASTNENSSAIINGGLNNTFI